MTNKKTEIAFFLPSLTSGGAERIMSFICQNLNKERFNAKLVIVGYAKQTKYNVNGVEVIYLNKERVLFSLFSIVDYLKKSDTNIVISAIRHMNAILGIISILFPKIKFIGREANVMSVLEKYPEENDREYPKFVYNFAYKLLDVIICQSQDMLLDLQNEFPSLSHKYHLINNPITHQFKTKTKKTISKEPYKFITVASLEPRKGHLRILKSLAKLNIDFEYTIIGNGSQLEKIQSLIEELHLEKKVVHISFTQNVNEYLAQSHIFIQGSYVEGFPNALLESCAMGTPVIAFNAPGGINEIVVNNVNGYIIENGSELETSIKKILSSNLFDPIEVSGSVFKKYDSKIILKKYETLFESLIKK